MIDPATHESVPGRLIAVEGVDGSGKSTQMDLLHKWLQGLRCRVSFSEWNSSPLVADATKKAKRRFLLTPTTFCLIHATDFADRYERQILPMLKAGYLVLCDRYVYTAFARDKARGCDPEWLRETYGFARPPDITFWFHVPVETALERLTKSRKEPNYFEAGMDLELSLDLREGFRIFQGRITGNYEEMVDEFGFVRMDATLPIHQQQQIMRRVVQDRIQIDDYPSRIEHVVHDQYGVAPPVFEEDQIDAEGSW